jgi:hypothetical protein
MTRDSLRGSKMSFKKEEEVTQEKSNEQRIKELEDMVRLMMKGKKADS